MNEIIAAIIGAVTGAILIWLSSWIKSKNGNRIIISKISQSPQIAISKEARKALSIVYKGKPVEQLVLSNLRVYNDGTSTINNVNFQIEISPKESSVIKNENFFIEIEHLDPLAKTELDYTPDDPTSPKLWTIDLKRPFINPRRAFPEDAIRLAVFSNHEIVFTVQGGGAGWYTRFADEEENRSSLYRRLTALGTSASVFSFLIIGVGTILMGLFIPFGKGAVSSIALIGLGVLMIILTGLFIFNGFIDFIIKKASRENSGNKP